MTRPHGSAHHCARFTPSGDCRQTTIGGGVSLPLGNPASGEASKRARDFTVEEIGVMRHRRRFQPASELAAVFGTTRHCVAALCRGVREA